MRSRFFGATKPSGFNEAGADCPGIPELILPPLNTELMASMRPGQTAPEFVIFLLLICNKSLGFNEAGADCPGILR